MTNQKVSSLNDLRVAFEELRHVNPMLELVERNINGTDHKVFKNAPPTLRDLINTVQLLMGDFPFINDEGKQYQFSEIIAKAKSISSYLAEQNLKPGDSVGICMQNSIDWVIAFLGVAGSGITCVPFNSGQLSADEFNASSIDTAPSTLPLTTKLTFKFFARSYLF